VVTGCWAVELIVNRISRQATVSEKLLRKYILIAFPKANECGFV
jgi:hypothetical protein